MTIDITYFSGSRANITGGEAWAGDWDELEGYLRSHTVDAPDKDRSGYFVACALRGGQRLDENAEPTRVLALDWDLNGAEPDWSSLAAMGEYVAHTTASHTPDEHHWRVWVHLAEPVGAAAVRGARSPWPGAKLRSISQPAYVPTTGDRTEWRRGGTAPVSAAAWASAWVRPAVPAVEWTPPATRTRPSERWRQAFVARVVGIPENTNRCFGALGSVLADCGWSNEDISAACTRWFGGAYDQTRHPNSALRAADRRRAGEDPVPGYPTLAELGVPWEAERPAEATAEELLAAADAQAIAEVETFGGVRALTAAAIATANIPEPSWLVQALVMAPGAPSLITGYGGSGKTTFVQHLAVCVAQGERVLGAWGARRGPVVHVDHEQGPELTQKRYQRLGLRADANLRLFSLPSWSLANPEQQAEFVRLALTARDGLIIIDSFLASCREYLEDGENSSDARAPLDFLTKVSVATGATILVIHHSRKDRSDRMTSARGTSAITDAVSLHITYEKDEHGPRERPKLRVGKTRHEPPVGAVLDVVEVAMAPRGAPADGGYTLVLGDAEATAAARADVLRTKVVSLLATGWRGSRNQLVTELKTGRTDTLRAVGELIEDGTVLDGRGGLSLGGTGLPVPGTGGTGMPGTEKKGGTESL